MLLYLFLPFVPLIPALVAALIIAGRVRREAIPLAVPLAAGLAALCTVAFGLPLMEMLYQGPPGAGGPWAGAAPLRQTISLSITYAIAAALLALPLAALTYFTRRPSPQSPPR